MNQVDGLEPEQEYLEKYRVELSGDTLEELRENAINELNEKLDFPEGLFKNPRYDDFKDLEHALRSIQHKMFGNPDLYQRQKEAEYLADVAFALEQELSDEQDFEPIAQ